MGSGMYFFLWIVVKNDSKSLAQWLKTWFLELNSPDKQLTSVLYRLCGLEQVTYPL